MTWYSGWMWLEVSSSTSGKTDAERELIIQRPPPKRYTSGVKGILAASPLFQENETMRRAAFMDAGAPSGLPETSPISLGPGRSSGFPRREHRQRQGPQPCP